VSELIFQFEEANKTEADAQARDLAKWLKDARDPDIHVDYEVHQPGQGEQGALLAAVLVGLTAETLRTVVPLIENWIIEWIREPKRELRSARLIAPGGVEIDVTVRTMGEVPSLMSRIRTALVSHKE
jgi:hypothetical protein